MRNALRWAPMFSTRHHAPHHHPGHGTREAELRVI
jgi:hypothetical protein